MRKENEELKEKVKELEKEKLISENETLKEKLKKMEENKNLPQKSQLQEAGVAGEETQFPTGDTGDEAPQPVEDTVGNLQNQNESQNLEEVPVIQSVQSFANENTEAVGHEASHSVEDTVENPQNQNESPKLDEVPLIQSVQSLANEKTEPATPSNITTDDSINNKIDLNKTTAIRIMGAKRKMPVLNGVPDTKKIKIEPTPTNIENVPIKEEKLNETIKFTIKSEIPDRVPVKVEMCDLPANINIVDLSSDSEDSIADNSEKNGIKIEKTDEKG